MGSKPSTTKMILFNILIMLLALGKGVQMVDPLATGASGDGETTDLNTYVSLIDENGDIHNGSETSEGYGMEPEMLGISAMKETSENGTTSIDSPDNETTSTSFSTTTVIPAEVTVTPMEFTSTVRKAETIPLTTEYVVVDTTTSHETTTVSSTSPTTVPTTFTDEETTNAVEQTSTLSSETTVIGNIEKSTEKVPQRSTMESTALLPNVERSVCTFLEKDFTCSEEIVCYGDGEIDCTDYDDEDISSESDSAKPMSSYSSKASTREKNEISSNTVPEGPVVDAADLADVESKMHEEYAEYDVESASIGTFPPNLVGVLPNKRIPFFLKSYTAPELDTNSTDEVQENLPTADARNEENEHTVTTVALLSENMKSTETFTAPTSFDATEKTTVPRGTQAQVSHPATTVDIVEPLLSVTESVSTLPSEQTTMGIDEVPKSTSDTLEIDEKVDGTTIHVELLEVPAVSWFNILRIRTKRELKRHAVIGNLRQKREETTLESNSSTLSMSFHAAALESTQKKLRVKVCRLSGDLVCSPVPTITMCKGKTFCQATSGTAETSETNFSTRRVETWAIIVIVVCGLSGFLTICLLIYLVVTSCKKLKVQPALEVTTLNYITRGAGANEAA